MKHREPISIANIGARAAEGAAALRAWQLLLLLIPLLFISATFLRMNNLGMVERRGAVLTNDQNGNTDAIQRSLADLQAYVSHHMNASLGKGLYLQYSYNRAYDAALTAASDRTNPNSAVYQQASIECRARWQGNVESFRNDYVQCVLQRVEALSPGKDAAAGAHLPIADNYRFDYVSPVWSPDFAGLFVALSGLVIVLIVIKGISYVVFRLLVRRYYHHA